MTVTSVTAHFETIQPSDTAENILWKSRHESRAVLPCISLTLESTIKLCQTLLLERQRCVYQLKRITKLETDSPDSPSDSDINDFMNVSDLL